MHGHNHTRARRISNAANNGSVVTSNHDLWQGFIAAFKGHKTRIVWVKGHDGDAFNEAADKLTRQTAEGAIRTKPADKSKAT